MVSGPRRRPAKHWQMMTMAKDHVDSADLVPAGKVLPGSKDSIGSVSKANYVHVNNTAPPRPNAGKAGNPCGDAVIAVLPGADATLTLVAGISPYAIIPQLLYMHCDESLVGASAGSSQPPSVRGYITAGKVGVVADRPGHTRGEGLGRGLRRAADLGFHGGMTWGWRVCGGRECRCLKCCDKRSASERRAEEPLPSGASDRSCAECSHCLHSDHILSLASGPRCVLASWIGSPVRNVDMDCAMLRTTYGLRRGAWKAVSKAFSAGVRHMIHRFRPCPVRSRLVRRVGGLEGACSVGKCPRPRPTWRIRAFTLTIAGSF
jgi:hypothetical protein